MKQMTRILIGLLAVSLLGVGVSFSALANGGPHGSFTASTDACAACHRAHSAKAPDVLLVSPEPMLCISCHDGTGAQTDVVNGVYFNGTSLRGGGFSAALMDTSMSGSASSNAVTSAHEINMGATPLWGHGAIDSGAGATYYLTCSNCHNPHGENTYRMLRPEPSGISPVVPVSIPDQPGTFTIADANGQYMGEPYGSLGTDLTQWCSLCHTRYLADSGSGHTDSGDDIFAFRHSTLNVACVTCHVSHGTSASMSGGAANVPWPDDASTPNGDGRSSLLRVDNRAVCVTCHVVDGRVTGGSCNSCHGAPPSSGAHLAHASTDVVAYGMVGAFSTSSTAIYGCGECHPTDAAMHNNGTVNVDLAAGTAPAGSLKALNDASAAFNGTSCGGVYCHSGQQVSSSAVGNPLTDGGGNYILDSHGNFTYAPYTVTISRNFATSPNWAGGTLSGNCTECHAYPLTTTVPGVQAGVGDSHQWVDDWGYGNLHAYNHGYTPLACRTCHYGEIIVAGATSRTSMDITTYSPVPLADKTQHANGFADVDFDTVNNYSYPTTPVTNINLALATFNSVDKSCTNVGCHIQQTYVVWGSPYRWWTNECDLCHRYGLPPVPSSGASLPSGFTTGSPVRNTHDDVNLGLVVCTDCHTEPHK